jgi:hypothetical protein
MLAKEAISEGHGVGTRAWSLLQAFRKVLKADLKDATIPDTGCWFGLFLRGSFGHVNFLQSKMDYFLAVLIQYRLKAYRLQYDYFHNRLGQSSSEFMHMYAAN